MEKQSIDRDDSGFFNKDFLNEKDLMKDSCFSHFEAFYSSSESPFRLIKARKNGRVFILKTLKEEVRETDLYRRILYKEFEISYRLGDHPYIRRTLCWEHIEPYGVCIVMEYVNGIVLSDFLSRASFVLTFDDVYRILDELCFALAFLHANQIIHSDLKLQNIILTRYGYHVKLIDFGYADCADYTVLKNLGGTEAYSAPEKTDPKANLDCRVDIYSLGFVILELNKPFGDKKLQHISSCCLQKDCSKRYSTIDKLAQELHEANKSHVIASSSPFLKWTLLLLIFLNVILSTFTFFILLA